MSLSKEDINASLADLDQSLAEIDSILKPILSKPLAETTKDMGPLENAQLQVTLAYTLNTLFYRKTIHLVIYIINFMLFSIHEATE